MSHDVLKKSHTHTFMCEGIFLYSIDLGESIDLPCHTFLSVSDILGHQSEIGMIYLIALLSYLVNFQSSKLIKRVRVPCDAT